MIPLLVGLGVIRLHSCSMTDFDESDFTSLDAFPLRWRFVAPRRHGIPAAVLASIRPLTAARANQLALTARSQCADERQFAVTVRSDDRPDAVRARLNELPPTKTDQILMSWDAETAVLCTWGVFVSYWDDFCYPSSDDVTVWPVDEQWTLCYRHYEIFQFRTRLQLAR